MLGAGEVVVVLLVALLALAAVATIVWVVTRASSRPFQSETSESSGAENTSGQGSGAVVPAGLLGWNWGAFFFSWIWGIAHSTWISLLALVPYVGLIMHIVLGVKGSEWAWRNRRFEGGVAEFKAVRRAWTKWALIVFLLIVGSVILLALAGALIYFVSGDGRHHG